MRIIFTQTCGDYQAGTVHRVCDFRDDGPVRHFQFEGGGMQNNVPSDAYREYNGEASTVPAENFVGTVAANVDNDKLDDAEFRAFIRRSLPVVVQIPPIIQPIN